MHHDLIQAQELLSTGSYTCVLCRGKQVRTCTARGVRPLLELLEEGNWAGFCAADKVVGKATALLYVLLGVRAVWAPVMSEGALRILHMYGIEAHFEAEAPAIVNRERSGLCPMETAVRSIDDPHDALPVIQQTLRKLHTKSRRISLCPYSGEADTATALIRHFWKAHNGEAPSIEDAETDLLLWTGPGHRFYFIHLDQDIVGFVHLGSRGCGIDWLEDIFVLPQHQRQGIGAEAIRQTEAIVREYSESLYIEAAARNEGAIRLYRKMGYDCLNTVTLRKDFHPERYETIRTDRILNSDFHVKRKKQS